MTSHEPKNPRVILTEDHRRIEALLERLLACVHADERESGEKAWTEVEESVLTHFNVEEMFVLPALADSHPSEVEGLLREHATIRRQLGEMGVAIDLHMLRAPTVEAFCSALRDHAEREESLAYVQAERKLAVSVARAIFDRIKFTTTKRGAARSQPTASRGIP